MAIVSYRCDDCESEDANPNKCVQSFCVRVVVAEDIIHLRSLDEAALVEGRGGRTLQSNFAIDYEQRWGFPQ